MLFLVCNFNISYADSMTAITVCITLILCSCSTVKKISVSFTWFLLCMYSCNLVSLTHFILKLVQTSCSQFLIISSNQSVSIGHNFIISQSIFKCDIPLESRSNKLSSRIDKLIVLSYIFYVAYDKTCPINSNLC